LTGISLDNTMDHRIDDKRSKEYKNSDDTVENKDVMDHKPNDDMKKNEVSIKKDKNIDDIDDKIHNENDNFEHDTE